MAKFNVKADELAGKEISLAGVPIAKMVYENYESKNGVKTKTLLSSGFPVLLGNTKDGKNIWFRGTFFVKDVSTTTPNSMSGNIL